MWDDIKNILLNSPRFETSVRALRIFEVIEKRYFYGMTLQEVADSMRRLRDKRKHISRERVRQMEARGLQILRHSINRIELWPDRYEQPI